MTQKDKIVNSFHLVTFKRKKKRDLEEGGLVAAAESKNGDF